MIKDLFCKVFGHRIQKVYFIDSDEKWYQCTLCGKSFIDQAYEREKKKVSAPSKKKK
jgi:transposase-like protein